jgi:hypothetical protein
MIKLIKRYFSQEQKLKRKKLRQLGNEIANSTDYDELVKLVYTYNSLKNEN